MLECTQRGMEGGRDRGEEKGVSKALLCLEALDMNFSRSPIGRLVFSGAIRTFLFLLGYLEVRLVSGLDHPSTSRRQL